MCEAGYCLWYKLHLCMVNETASITTTCIDQMVVYVDLAGRTLISFLPRVRVLLGIASFLLLIDHHLEIFSKGSIPLMSQWLNNFSEISTSVRLAVPRPSCAAAANPKSW